MRKRTYQSGDIIHRLTILGLSHKWNGEPRWVCKCNCGRICIVNDNWLKREPVVSCGCDLLGKKYGRLTFIDIAMPLDDNGIDYCKLGKGEFFNGEKEHFRQDYFVKCDCGAEKIIERNHIIYGEITSCGCDRKFAKGTLIKPSNIPVELLQVYRQCKEISIFNLEQKKFN